MVLGGKKAKINRVQNRARKEMRGLGGWALIKKKKRTPAPRHDKASARGQKRINTRPERKRTHAKSCTMEKGKTSEGDTNGGMRRQYVRVKSKLGRKLKNQKEQAAGDRI